MKNLVDADIADLLWYVDAEPLRSLPGGCLTSFANRLRSRFFTGEVSEVEARERERAAFLEGGAWFESFSRKAPASKSAVDMLSAKRDERYPSLAPKLRTVTLSDHQMYQRVSDDSRTGRLSYWRRVSDNRIATPDCCTAEDFEKCAALLREDEPLSGSAVAR